MKRISEEENFDIGSGYPGDPKAKKFLRHVIESNIDCKYIRKSWQTYITLDSARKQRKLF